MLKNKKMTICIISSLLISISSLAAIKVNAIKEKSRQNAISILNKDQNQYAFEYSKKKLSDNTYEERWRNNKNAEERLDIKDANDNLISSTIVTNGGSKVISYVKENDKMVAHSWILPPNVAAENKKILSSPLSKQVNSDISSKNWTYKDNSTLDNKSVRKLVNSDDSKTTTIYLDNNTGVLLKSESKLKNSIDFTEVFSKLTELPESKFQLNGIEIEELSPVIDNVVGKG